MKELNAKNLKQALWETLNDVKSGDKPPAEADAIASQSREILRTVKTQLQIARQANRQVTVEMIAFAENSEVE